MEAVVERTFNLVKRELRKCEYVDRLPMGVVLTGGSSRLVGLSDLAEQIFRMPARQGAPGLVDGGPNLCSPGWATCAGLVLHGLSGRNRRNHNGDERGGLLGRIWGGLRRTFNKHF